MTARTVYADRPNSAQQRIGYGYPRSMPPGVPGNPSGPLFVGNYAADPDWPDLRAALTVHHIDDAATYVGIWNGPLASCVGAMTLFTGFENIPYVANTVTTLADIVAFNADASLGLSGAKTVTNATMYFAQPMSTQNNSTVTNTYSFRSGAPNAGTGVLVNFTGFHMAANSTAMTGDKKGMFIGAMTGIAANAFGIDIAGMTGSAQVTIAAGMRIAQPLGGAANHALWLENSASTPPTMIWRNVAQSTITVTIPTSITSWTWTLPPDDGDAGEQLQTNGAGVSTWEAAASWREVKVLHGTFSGDEALRRIQSAPVYRFHYDPNAKHVGGDYETEFVGIVADEAPWAMQHKGRIFSPINAFGHAVAAIQALAARIEALEAA